MHNSSRTNYQVRQRRTMYFFFFLFLQIRSVKNLLQDGSNISRPSALGDSII